MWLQFQCWPQVYILLFKIRSFVKWRIIVNYNIWQIRFQRLPALVNQSKMEQNSLPLEIIFLHSLNYFVSSNTVIGAVKNTNKCFVLFGKNAPIPKGWETLRSWSRLLFICSVHSEALNCVLNVFAVEGQEITKTGNWVSLGNIAILESWEESTSHHLCSIQYLATVADVFTTAVCTSSWKAAESDLCTQRSHRSAGLLSMLYLLLLLMLPKSSVNVRHSAATNQFMFIPHWFPFTLVYF